MLRPLLPLLFKFVDWRRVEVPKIVGTRGIVSTVVLIGNKGRYASIGGPGYTVAQGTPKTRMPVLGFMCPLAD